jgi:hypothetical protein
MILNIYDVLSKKNDFHTHSYMLQQLLGNGYLLARTFFFW